MVASHCQIPSDSGTHRKPSNFREPLFCVEFSYFQTAGIDLKLLYPDSRGSGDDFLPRRGLLCRASKFWMMLVRLSVRLSDVTLIWVHLDADPDLDASTNRAFRDVRDVGLLSFS